MKKVCHITSVHKPNDNRIFYKECLSLRNEGYDMTIVAPVEKETSIAGVRIVPLGAKVGRLKRMILRSFFGVIKKSLGVRADIYHFHDPEIIPAGLVLRLLGKKVIYDAHENLSAAIRSKPYLSKVVRWPLSLLVHSFEHFSAMFFSGVITARPDISATFKRKVCTLRNFPKLSDLQKESRVEIDKERFSVIYVGGMTDIRGIRELVDAFADLDDCELWLLGSFGSQSLEDYCHNSSGWKNVRYLGQVEPHQIFGYIEKADVGIVTFYPEPNHVTTLATKPFEYMSCGLPMIMSDFEYWRDFFKGGAIYVDPKKSEAIAEAVQDLKVNNERRSQMGQENKRLIQEEYNWEKESELLGDFYKKIFS